MNVVSFGFYGRVSDGCCQCKEKMRPVKKALKQLGSPELSGQSHEDHLEHTRRCLLKIGDHINELLAAVDRAAEVRDWRKLVSLQRYLTLSWYSHHRLNTK